MLPIFDAFVDFNRFQQDVARTAQNTRAANVVVPALDLREDNDAFVFEIDLPGVKLADLTLAVDGDQLRVDAQVKRGELAEGARIHRTERHIGAYHRAFRMPRTVDPQRIEAKLVDGVLTLTLGKRSEVRPRAIEVKAS